ncbi:MAG: acyl-CoA/acyl-ACP dehydrogenase [Acidimicrobiaceae bacterium]|nr:acyl-CoA/acyl-ACP dehydrogenase [Acidimicrobiaceae bacterium]
MDLMLNDTQEMIRDGARRFLADSLDPDTVREVEASADGVNADIWAQMAELGWTALALPTDIGGGGAGLADLCVLAEELGRAAASTPLVATAGFAATFLQAVEPTAVTRDMLSTLATSGAVITPALIDAVGRDERSASSSVLFETDAGATISGAKAMVPYASVARVLLVSLTTPDGESAFVAVNRDAAGVRWTRHGATGGDPLFHVEFDNVEVPADSVLARGRAAERAIEAGLDAATILATAEAVGCCEGMIRLASEHASSRQQFGRVIGSYQAVSHRLADMRINTDACRLLVAETAWTLDQGRETPLEVAGTKVFANEVIVDMIHAAHTVHGAIGYTTEYDLQLYTRRARAFCLSHGDTDTQTERAAVALGL